jgi:tetratricopeptide (TPR) repeat protein
MDVIEMLIPRVLGALALEFEERLALFSEEIRSVPTWEASQEFLRGTELYLTQLRYGEATDRFLRAHELDSTFVTPLTYALMAQRSASGSMRGDAKMDSILAVLTDHETDLTPYERAVVASYRARSDGDRSGTIRGLREACDLVPGSKPCYNLARLYLGISNDPRRSIDYFTTRLTPEQGWMRDWWVYWHQLAESYHVAGEFELELETIERGREYYPDGADLVEYKAYALSGLGRVEEVFAFLEDSLPALLPNGNHAAIAVRVGVVLNIEGLHSDAIRAWEFAWEWHEEQVGSDPESWSIQDLAGWIMYLLGRLEEAEEHWQLAADIAPDNPYNQSNFGMIAAKRGDLAEGRRAIEWLEAQTEASPLTVLQAKAFVAQAMGEYAEAVSYLEELWTHRNMYSFELTNRVIPFSSLFGYESYQELYWPGRR